MYILHHTLTALVDYYTYIHIALMQMTHTAAHTCTVGHTAIEPCCCTFMQTAHNIGHIAVHNVCLMHCPYTAVHTVHTGRNAHELLYVLPILPILSMYCCTYCPYCPCPHPAVHTCPSTPSTILTQCTLPSARPTANTSLHETSHQGVCKNPIWLGYTNILKPTKLEELIE